jgi:cytochrome c-type biogenesis protein CcmF
VDPAAFGFAPEAVDLSVAARLTLVDTRTGQTRALRPVYLVTTDRRQEVVPDRAADLGVTVAFVGMDVEANAIRLAVEGTTVEPEAWVVVQAYEKPFISILWIGTLVLLAGFGLAVYRRASEARR